MFRTRAKDIDQVEKASSISIIPSSLSVIVLGSARKNVDIPSPLRDANIPLTPPLTGRGL